MDTSRKDAINPATIAVGHGGVKHALGAISTPIFQTAQFELPGDYTYTRLSNPTVVELERRLACLEGGEYAAAFASGMAAIAALVRTLARRGAIYLVRGCYAGTSRLCRAEAAVGALDWQVLDLNSENWQQAVQPPATIWLESPMNPLLTEIPIAKIREQFPEDVQIVVDNTLATPALQRPLEYGATHVVHSASKFLGGHSDAIAGVVVTRDEQTFNYLRQYRTSHGGCLDPFAAWLVLRGMQTLYVRMRHAAETAHTIARMLETHPGVAKVYYPGLQAPWQRPGQMKTGGAVVTSHLASQLCLRRFMESLRIVKVAESLGGVESLINQSATMSHSSLPNDEKQAVGLDERIFRLSIGLEEPIDLINDLTNSLEEARQKGASNVLSLK